MLFLLPEHTVYSMIIIMENHRLRSIEVQVEYTNTDCRYNTEIDYPIRLKLVNLFSTL